MKPEEDVLELRILTDRCSMEIYACGGSFNTALCTVLDPSKTEIKPVYIDPATAVNVDIHKIASTLGSA